MKLNRLLFTAVVSLSPFSLSAQQDQPFERLHLGMQRLFDRARLVSDEPATLIT